MSSRFDAVLISIGDVIELLDFRVFLSGASGGAPGFWASPAFPEREVIRDLALSSRWVLSAAFWSFPERKERALALSSCPFISAARRDRMPSGYCFNSFVTNFLNLALVRNLRRNFSGLSLPIFLTIGFFADARLGEVCSCRKSVNIQQRHRMRCE